MSDSESDSQLQGPARPWRRRLAWLGILSLMILCGVGYFAWTSRPDPLPPITSSPYSNTTSRAEYVGTRVCVDCHASQYESYLETAHSDSFGRVDPAVAPPNGQFHQYATGRTYQVDRDGDQMRHRELVWMESGEPFVLSDFPIRFRIGSGIHAISYAAEVDGFLVESPVTWFSRHQAWEMSPGYDVPNHPGFQRPVTEGCLYCHTGRAVPVENSYHRFRIHTAAIGCERCHGPGSLHVELRELDSTAPSDVDSTIVHPARLTRQQKEDICAQCHLAGDVAVDLRGRKLTRFRPGLSLNDFRAYFALHHSDHAMTVVGHVEQLHLSRCYRESETLTCTSCHNPHLTLTPEARLGFFRSQCLDCHTTQSCDLPDEGSLRRNVEDNCVACHMPRSQSEVPHVAVTHHRIGIHPGGDSAPAGNWIVPSAVPINDLSHVPPVEQERLLGLAYLKLTEEAVDASTAREYARRARKILERVRDAGLRDPEMEAGLAQLHWQMGSPEASVFAEQVLQSDEASPHAHSTALFVAASSLLKQDQTDRAIELLNKLNPIRRNAVHWILLSDCQLQRGDLRAAADALQEAVKIAPADHELHDRLADLYDRLGDATAAEEHRRIARLLRSPGYPPND